MLDQFVEALHEQCMAFFWNLLGLAQRDQNTAQVRKQTEMVVESGVGHDVILKCKNRRESIKLCAPVLWIN